MSMPKEIFFSLTNDSLLTLRKMRGAILKSKLEKAAMRLNEANMLAQTVGELVVNTVLKEDTTLKKRTLHMRLRPLQKKYKRSPSTTKTMQYTYSTSNIGEALLRFARSTRQELDIESDKRIAKTGTKQELLEQIDRCKAIYAPLSADLLFAHVASQLLERIYGRGIAIIPVATSLDNRKVVISPYAPVYDDYTVYTDANGSYGTFAAIERALRTRREKMVLGIEFFNL
jgi:hypothetical protein